MTHDYAKKNKTGKKKPKANKTKPKPAPQNRVPGWAWLLTGIVIGVFISFLGFLADIPAQSKPADSTALIDKPDIKPQDDKPTTRFDFYTLLPEREVIVPDEQPRQTANNKPPQEIIYILQAGSFKQAADADRLRAKLILLGLETKVEAVSGQGNGTWHRVQVGPFKSRSRLSKTRSLLINEGIETLLLKRKVGV